MNATIFSRSNNSPSQSSSSTTDILVLIALAALMLATRAFHVASTLHLPDASWAIFFIAGLYLGFASFGVLLIEAVAIDVIYVMNGGDNYCFSVAYGFLAVAYLVLWFGGYWAGRLQQNNSLHKTSAQILRTVFAWLVAGSVAYLLTNGSFYWLSGKATSPTLNGWLLNAKRWAFGFIVQPMFYLGVAAVVHFIVVQIKAREMKSTEIAGS